MKSVSHTLYLAPAAAAFFILTSFITLAQSGDKGGMPRSDSAWEGSGSLYVGDHEVPLTYDPLLLSLGRAVYADLQVARQAALNKEATNLRVSLKEAQDTIRRLRLPSQLMALNAQLRVIRNDFEDTSKSLDDDLWVPVETQIDEVLVDTPWEVEVRPKTKEALRKGGSAAGKSRRETAWTPLDVDTSSLRSSLGIFPLHKVKQDLDAACATANLPTPDWAGTLEAVQNALATFHWYTRISTQDLQAAYNDVVNAYVLASGPQFRPDQKQQVLDYLAKAEKNLINSPGGEPMAEKTKGLIDNNDRHASDIKLVLGDIQSEILLERQRAEAQYWDAIGR
jgi:phosphoglycerate-specific signal transduction histidine kinase